ncbi:MAG: VOC family protein [Chloroflexi bacterium]|nr:VOC family protein [Chloroflexota bacterium]
MNDRIGQVHWIDHYVVPVSDVPRWVEFSTNIFGSDEWIHGSPPFGKFRKLAGCHHGGFVQKRPLPPGSELGKAPTRYGHYIQPGDIDEHLRRLDQHGIHRSEVVDSAPEGRAGKSIYFEDPDGNQYEFFAPEKMPDGAMAAAGPLKIGRISHVTFDARDLDTNAEFFSRFCGVDPIKTMDVPDDTLVIDLAGGARIIYKHASELKNLRSGAVGWVGPHTALVLREPQFMPAYRQMWAALDEWAYDFKESLTDDPLTLGPRTGMHGSEAGQKWKQLYQRGDAFFDNDTNEFHFVGGIGLEGDSLTTYRGRYMEDYVADLAAGRISPDEG